MKERSSSLLDILLRYAILILIGALGLKIFYFFFTYLTVYPTYFLLNLFFNASLASNTILLNGFPIEIIGACVAGSAYYLLLILNLSIRGIKIKKRIEMLLFSFASLLIVNILRIFFLSILYVNGTSFFDIAHRLFWYAGSTVFVAGIWFLSVKIFKVKGIPFYSDVVHLLNSGKKPKKTKSSKKH